MDGKIFNIQRFCVEDGPGIRTTIFLHGCSLKCEWCHNPESIYSCDFDVMSPESVFDILHKDLLYYQNSGGGITVSGGEPLLQSEFVHELFTLCKKEGISTAVDTSGHVDFSQIQKIKNVCDLFLFDLKTTNNELFLKHCRGNNNLVKQNLKSISLDGANIIVRIPIIPNFNNTYEEVEKMASFLNELGIKKICLIPFHQIGKSKYQKYNFPYLYENEMPLNKDDCDKYLKIFNKYQIDAL